MTNCQVLEWDLSAVQFEDLSDEMASSIQGGTGDSGNGNGDIGSGDLFDFGNMVDALEDIQNELNLLDEIL